MVAHRELVARRDQTGIGGSSCEVGSACLNDSDIETSAARRLPSARSCPVPVPMPSSSDHQTSP